MASGRSNLDHDLFFHGWLSATWDFAQRSSMRWISTPGQQRNGRKFYLNCHHNVTSVELQNLTSSPISTIPYITFTMYVFHSHSPGQMRFRAILGAQFTGLTPSCLHQLSSNMYTITMGTNRSQPICGWRCKISLAINLKHHHAYTTNDLKFLGRQQSSTLTGVTIFRTWFGAA